MNRTELRHRILRRFADDKCSYYPGMMGNPGQYEYLGESHWDKFRGGERRAVTDLDDALLLSFECGLNYSRRRAFLTIGGQTLLAEWDEKYGPVTP